MKRIVSSLVVITCGWAPVANAEPPPEPPNDRPTLWAEAPGSQTTALSDVASVAPGLKVTSSRFPILTSAALAGTLSMGRLGLDEARMRRVDTFNQLNQRTKATSSQALVRFAPESNSPCASMTAGYFTHTRHAKGDRGGILNENTWGSSVSCYFDEERHFHLVVGGLINSRRGYTFIGGPGVTLRTPRWRNLTAGAGYELPYVYYVVPKMGAISGFLPVESRMVHWHFPEQWGTLGLIRREFGPSNDRIHLYLIEWGVSY